MNPKMWPVNMLAIKQKKKKKKALNCELHTNDEQKL